MRYYSVILRIYAVPVNTVSVLRRSDLYLRSGSCNNHQTLIAANKVVNRSFAVRNRFIWIARIIRFCCGAGFNGDRLGIDDKFIPSHVYFVVFWFAGGKISSTAQRISTCIRSSITCSHGDIGVRGHVISTIDDTIVVFI